MGADDDVDSAFGELLEGFSTFGGVGESVEEGDVDVESGKAFGEAPEVLLGKDGGWAEESNLFAGLGNLECGADGDLGFSESDVAADQAIHRVVGFEVDFDFVDCLELGWGFDVREGVFHLLDGVGIGFVGVTLNGFSFGVKLDQVPSELSGFLASLGDGFLPLPPR